MIPEIILAILLGFLAGTLTGLIPGLHVNLLSAILLAVSASLTFQPLALSAFIVVMAITHTVINFVPSIFLGAPEEDTFLSILPGHQFVLEGKGHEASLLTILGSILAIIIIIILTPTFIIFLPKIQQLFLSTIPYILIFISLYLILREKSFIKSSTVFLLSGLLGLLSFSLPVNQPLLPLLSGLFGISALITSIQNKPKIPKQVLISLKDLKISKKDLRQSFLGSLISTPFSSFLPGIGSGHAALIGSELIPQTKKSFLILLGAINTIVMTLSFVTIYSISRTRSGAAVALSELLPDLNLTTLLFFLELSLITIIIASILAIQLSKTIARNITKVSYSTLSILIIIFLVSLTLYFSSFIGLLILLTASSLGAYTILSGTRRINLMGVLIIPTIIFYLTS